MRRIFADSLYWIAIASPKDQWHAQAIVASRRFRGEQIVTTEEIMTEFLNAFRNNPFLRRVAVNTVHQIQNTPGIVLRAQSGQSFLSGLALYEARYDKAYSLTDCISMAAMRDEGISEVLTHDGHFAQEGFTLLL